MTAPGNPGAAAERSTKRCAESKSQETRHRLPHDLSDRRGSLDHAKEIYDFLVSLGPVLHGFNVEEQEGVNQTSTLTDRSDRVERFFQELYDLARENGFDPPIREFENVCGSIAAGSGSDDNQQFTLIGFDHFGRWRLHDVFTRTTGDVRKAYGGLEIGNVKTVSFRGALEGDEVPTIITDVSAGVKRCAGRLRIFRRLWRWRTGEQVV